MPHCSPQQTTAEPTADQETTQNPLCFKNTLVETYNKSIIQNPLYNQETPHTAPCSRQTTSTNSLYNELHSSNSRTQYQF